MNQLTIGLLIFILGCGHAVRSPQQSVSTETIQKSEPSISESQLEEKATTTNICPVTINISELSNLAIVENYVRTRASQPQTCLLGDLRIEIVGDIECSQSLVGWNVGNLVAFSKNEKHSILIEHDIRFQPGGANRNTPVKVKIPSATTKKFDLRINSCFSSSEEQELFAAGSLKLVYRMIANEVLSNSSKVDYGYREMFKDEAIWEQSFNSQPLEVQVEKLTLPIKKNTKIPQLYFDAINLHFEPNKPVISKDNSMLAYMHFPSNENSKGDVFTATDLTSGEEIRKEWFPSREINLFTPKQIESIKQINIFLHAKEWTPLLESRMFDEESNGKNIEFEGLIVSLKNTWLTVKSSLGHLKFRKSFPEWIVGPYCGFPTTNEGECYLECINRPYIRSLYVDENQTILFVKITHTGNDTCLEPETIIKMIPLKK